MTDKRPTDIRDRLLTTWPWSDYLAKEVYKLGTDLTPRLVEEYIDLCKQAAAARGIEELRKQFSTELELEVSEFRFTPEQKPGDRILDKLCEGAGVGRPIRARDIPAKPDPEAA